jgi:hypothetical protein
MQIIRCRMTQRRIIATSSRIQTRLWLQSSQPSNPAPATSATSARNGNATLEQRQYLLRQRR